MEQLNLTTINRLCKPLTPSLPFESLRMIQRAYISGMVCKKNMVGSAKVWTPTLTLCDQSMSTIIRRRVDKMVAKPVQYHFYTDTGSW